MKNDHLILGCSGIQPQESIPFSVPANEDTLIHAGFQSQICKFPDICVKLGDGNILFILPTVNGQAGSKRRLVLRHGSQRYRYIILLPQSIHRLVKVFPEIIQKFFCKDHIIPLR